MLQARAVEKGRSAFSERYNTYFKVIDADTPELLDSVHSIRYQVYCVERPFEDPDDNPNEREIDEFDKKSVHSLLIYRDTDEVAGTVRLILPSKGAKAPDLPMQQACPFLETWPDELLPVSSTAEISRFTISSDFRRRASDTFYADTGISGRYKTAKPKDRRFLPEITIGLLRAIVNMSQDNDVTHWCAIMEPALLRLLARMGVYFNPIGPLVEYHGWRQPVYGKFSEIYEGLRQRRNDIWQVISD